MTDIASPANPRVLDWQRRRGEWYFFAGEKLVRDLLALGTIPDQLLVEAGHPLEHDLAGATRELWRVSPRVMARVSGLATPPPCLAVIYRIPEGIPWGLDRVVWGLVGVQDPGNAGTLLRAAAAFGFGSLALAAGGASPANPKFIRAAQTALLGVRFARFPTLAGLLAEARAAGYQAVATGARPARGAITPAELPDKALILLGSEGAGLPPELLAEAPVLSIPQEGAVDSLNVAMAGSILMHWVRREGGG